VLGGTSALYLPGFMLSLVTVGLLLWAGIAHFRRTERTFADML
jgi:lipopolysaccharide transport system permease protein